MAETRDLLIEIGTEELPPLALTRLEAAFKQAVLAGLEKLGFSQLNNTTYATPRRLAVLVERVPVRQAEQTIERRGPALQAAFDQDGNATKAAQGFARSCGVELEQLERLETPKGTWLYYKSTEAGKETKECIAEIVEQALAALPIPKRMRWGSGEAEFVRPVQWVVLLFAGEVIKANILGASSSRETRGHRFHHPSAITIGIASDYAERLYAGYVIPVFADRREKIKQDILAAADTLGGHVDLDADANLLDEVTALVEWPVVITCHFDEHFLEVPPEVLVSSMKTHQKYFPVYDSQQQLSNHFIVVSNLESRYPEWVQEGNERVIRPRLADAAFFWEQDRKQTLATYNERLKTVIFQKKLGTVYAKVERIATLSGAIAQYINADVKAAERAGLLCKADLVTDMVGEFPKLQGIMGRYYAKHSGETEHVAAAIAEHYQPRFAGDALPATACGQAVAIADKLDTLLGIFAAGQKPSGEKDPFALRRAALGLLKIIIDKRLDLDLHVLLTLAAQQFESSLHAPAVVDDVLAFILARLRSEYEADGYTPQQIEAVMACGPTHPLDFDKRVHAVKAFSALPEAETLSEANKRIANILKKFKGVVNSDVNSALLKEAEEKTLHQTLAELLPEIEPLCVAGQYEQALIKLASLHTAITAFFDKVMVMADDEKLKQNRLALLQQLHNAFTRVADIACLQS